jgi:hypothetical protein
MEEAKARIEAIETTLEGRTQLPEVFGDEFCTLQLRMICELIALGCLLTHGDIQETLTKAMRDEYAAHRIIAQLNALHPDFYPHPVRQIADPGPSGFYLQDIGNDLYLTKEDLVELAGRCGAALHRGSVSDILVHRALQPNDISRWVLKIRTLLDIHWFKLRSGEPLYLCSLRHGENGGVGVEFLPTSRADRP